MVCGKCQKLNKTVLATPGVKKKSEMYYGSPASSSASGEKKSATLGQTGISKVWSINISRHSNELDSNSHPRVNCCPRQPRIPMHSTQAPASAARPR